MRIASAWSTDAMTEEAVAGAYLRLTGKLGRAPSLLFVFFTEGYAASDILSALAFLPASVKVHGCTSCRGVMTGEGFHSQDGRALGMLGLFDDAGVFGVGMARQNGDPRGAAIVAIEAALADAGRPGEVPDLVWLNASPGHEEDVIKGIHDVVGSSVLLAGGSAADEAMTSNWKLMERNAVQTDAVLISVMFPSCQLSSSFEGGYSPTVRRGVVTGATGRTVHTIDGRPAATVYDEWTDQRFALVVGKGRCFSANTTFSPLGCAIGKVGDVSYYSLSHLEAVLPDLSLRLLTQIDVGQELVLMTGTADSLASRMSRAVSCAIDTTRLTPRQAHGALVVCCAGNLLAIGDEISKVAENIRRSLCDGDFLGIFTFGEQGCFLGVAGGHGNLMTSSIVFSD